MRPNLISMRRRIYTFTTKLNFYIEGSLTFSIFSRNSFTIF